jgi:hypothetical protein
MSATVRSVFSSSSRLALTRTRRMYSPGEVRATGGKRLRAALRDARPDGEHGEIDLLAEVPVNVLEDIKNRRTVRRVAQAVDHAVDAGHADHAFVFGVNRTLRRTIIWSEVSGAGARALMMGRRCS